MASMKQGPGASKLVASEALIEMISLELKKEFERLENALGPGERQKTMHSFGLRAVSLVGCSSKMVLNLILILEEREREETSQRDILMMYRSLPTYYMEL